MSKSRKFFAAVKEQHKELTFEDAKALYKQAPWDGKRVSKLWKELYAEIYGEAERTIDSDVTTPEHKREEQAVDKKTKLEKDIEELEKKVAALKEQKCKLEKVYLREEEINKDKTTILNHVDFNLKIPIQRDDFEFNIFKARAFFDAKGVTRSIHLFPVFDDDDDIVEEYEDTEAEHDHEFEFEYNSDMEEDLDKDWTEREDVFKRDDIDWRPSENINKANERLVGGRIITEKEFWKVADEMGYWTESGNDDGYATDAESEYDDERPRTEMGIVKFTVDNLNKHNKQEESQVNYKPMNAWQELAELKEWEKEMYSEPEAHVKKHNTSPSRQTANPADKTDNGLWMQLNEMLTNVRDARNELLNVIGLGSSECTESLLEKLTNEDSKTSFMSNLEYKSDTSLNSIVDLDTFEIGKKRKKCQKAEMCMFCKESLYLIYVCSMRNTYCQKCNKEQCKNAKVVLL